MNDRTESERLFEQLCARREIACHRIPEGPQKTADYRVDLASDVVVAEIKQLDPSPGDRELEVSWGTKDSPGAIAPADRVQGLIGDGYPQLKRSSEGKVPGMLVVYNNSGAWNWIDEFTVSKAMFGAYGIVLGLKANQEVEMIGAGYLGGRKVTKSTLRALSGVGVVDLNSDRQPRLTFYHNPFAERPIDPAAMRLLADGQYRHPDPHSRGYVPWEPNGI